MKVGIMQPYFFPYIGYFSIIKYVDLFILFDTPQYITRGWINRNRIKNQQTKWQYITVPLKKHSSRDVIKNIEISNNENWQEKIILSLGVYKKAPYYDAVIKLIQNLIGTDDNSIVRFNYRCLKGICDYLNIHTEITIFSEMNLQLDEVASADEWALRICQKIGKVKEYINPPGGKAFFDTEKYIKSGIDIKFMNPRLQKYYQGKGEFVEGLSIIDILMYNSKEKILNMLEEYEFV